MIEQVVVNGAHYPSGVPLVPVLDLGEFAERIRGRLEANQERLRSVTPTRHSLTYRAELGRVGAPDPTDPLAAGWSYIVAAGEPDRSAIVEVLRPLAELRGMTDPSSPLTYDGRDPHEWVLNALDVLPTKERPYYLLLVGGPDRLSFDFQAFLDVTSAVGRLCFRSLDELRAYVDKLTRLNDPTTPAPCRPEAIVLATDHGWPDPTYYSRSLMAEPLVGLIRESPPFEPYALTGPSATKTSFWEVASRTAPALVYSATHGAEAAEETTRRTHNGALLCHAEAGTSEEARWMAAADVDALPRDEPFLEGSVFFAFACCSYGTPAESDFAHWDLQSPKVMAEEDFVAALPQALLAHPRGPVAFVGHLDKAFLHAFDDPAAPGMTSASVPRLAPFRRAVEAIVSRQPAGFALAEMNGRFHQLNLMLSNVLDQIARGELRWDEVARSRLASTFIMRSDAQHYLVFGDPAAACRVATD